MSNDEPEMTNEEKDTVIDLIHRYGKCEMLTWVSIVAEGTANDKAVSRIQRQLDKRIRMEIDLLLDRMAEYESLLEMQDISSGTASNN
jgi:hypothetical protein